MTEEPKKLSVIDATIPAAVEHVVERALSKDPQARPTAVDLGREIAEAFGL